jgi:hypothetical protein
MNQCYNSNTPITSNCLWPSLAQDNQLLALNADVNNPLNCNTIENYQGPQPNSLWCNIETREYYESTFPLKIDKAGSSGFKINIDNMSHNVTYSPSNVSEKCSDLIYVAGGPIQIKCPKRAPCTYSKTSYSIGLTTPLGGYTYSIYFPSNLGEFNTIVVGAYGTSSCPLPKEDKPAIFKLYVGNKNVSVFTLSSSKTSVLKTIKLKKNGNNYIVI